MPLKLIRRHGSPNWYIRGTVRGIAVDETTGTPDEAAAEALRIKKEAELLNRSVFGERATATWLEASVSYGEAGGEVKYLDRIDKHFGTIALAKVNQAAIDRCARALYPDAKPSTVNRQIYTPISAVLKHAARRGLCEYRPVERPRQPKGRIRWLRHDEAERLIAACSEHMRPLVVFLLYTGARVSEALYLDWRDVDLSRAHVAFLDTKNGSDRGVPLHPRLVAELANLPHKDGRVFRRPDGQPYEEQDERGGQIKTGFRGACRRAGINNFRPHDCRHTWATWHYAANRDLVGLMELGGWKSERMVMRYAHVNVDNLAASIQALPWGNHGEGQIGKAKSERKSA